MCHQGANKPAQLSKGSVPTAPLLILHPESKSAVPEGCEIILSAWAGLNRDVIF